jgi:hypothetical protein
VSDLSSVRAFLARLRLACRANRVLLTPSTQQEADALGFDVVAVEHVLMNLETEDFEKLVPSTRRPGDVIWVFVPVVDGDLTLWIRMIERGNVVVISFHDRYREED